MQKDFPDGIRQCGTDALRFSLVQYTQQGRQINLDVQRVVSMRHFCNKIWQATRFCLGHFENHPEHRFNEPSSNDNLTNGDLINRWILSRLANTVGKVTHAMDTYMFSDATTAIYDFFLHEFCDVYLELAKPILYGRVVECDVKSTLDTLFFCLDTSFRLMHPFMPFVTEELWQRLPFAENDNKIKPKGIMECTFPDVDSFTQQFINNDAELQMNQVMDVVLHIRSLTRQLQADGAIKGNTQRVFVTVPSTGDNSESLIALLRSQRHNIEALTKVANVEVMDDKALSDERRKRMAVGVVSAQITIFVPLEMEHMAHNLKQLDKKYQAVVKQIEKLETQMALPQYESNVPLSVKEKNVQKLEGWLEERDKLMHSMEQIREALSNDE